MTSTPTGDFRPLGGIRVLDLSALGPGPFATMILADHGAEVIHVLRPGATGPDPSAYLRRGKHEITVDLRSPEGPEVIARMADGCDVLLEGNRPGVMERRGLGPDVLHARNPRLVYTRLTGWGQTGPNAQRAGHDINYLATSGVLGTIGTDEPVPPLAFVGDFASGSLQAVIGTLLALLARERTGVGQVVDAAIVDGSALLLSAAFGEAASGMWSGDRGTHVLSGTAPFYGVYECSDGGWFSVGAIEPPFYDSLLTALAIDADRRTQWDQDQWPTLRADIAQRFRARTRDEWSAIFAPIDACATPVLDIDELDTDEHLRYRRTVVRDGERLTSGISPRLAGLPTSAEAVHASRPHDILKPLGFDRREVDGLMHREVVGPPPSNR